MTARRRRSAESRLCLQLPLGAGCSVRKGWQLGLRSEEHGWVFLLCFFPLQYEYGNAEEQLLLAPSSHSSLLLAWFYVSENVYVSGRSVPSKVRLMFKMLAAVCGSSGSIRGLGGEGWSAPLYSRIDAVSSHSRSSCVPALVPVVCGSYWRGPSLLGQNGLSLASVVRVLFAAAGWMCDWEYIEHTLVHLFLKMLERMSIAARVRLSCFCRPR